MRGCKHGVRGVAMNLVYSATTSLTWALPRCGCVTSVYERICFRSINEQSMIMMRQRGEAQWKVFFFSSRRRHTRSLCDWSSDVCFFFFKQKTAYEITV